MVYKIKFANYMHAHKHVSLCKSLFFLVCTLTCALTKNTDERIYILTYLLEVQNLHNPP